MASPFPGMDPYLEHPAIFPDFHDSFVTYLRETLQPHLPEPYYSAIGRRAWVEVSERYIGPDVHLSRSQHKTRDTESTVAVATRIAAEPLVIRVPHDEYIEPFVEIAMGRGSDRRLVTAIEVLSLTNKNPGEHGRELYLRKQREIMESNVHLVEIDLLRDGQHTTAVPLDRLTQVTARPDYHVCIHHFDNLEDYFFHPIALTQSLPSIKIPLLPGDGEVTLDLQQVFERTYESGPYRREIDYQQDTPTPPLTTERDAWAREQVAKLAARN